MKNIPDALLFITPGCPHCPAVLQGLSELVKQGMIGSLEVVNAALRPERAAELGVRSAPWTRIGPFILEGSQRPAELKKWAEMAGTEKGICEYLKELLSTGQLAMAERFIENHPEYLAATLPLINDPETAIQVRLGVSVLFEEQTGSATLQSLVTKLGEMSQHEDHRVRSDACHLLGLSQSSAALPFLQQRLNDEHPEVREISEEGLEILRAGS